LGLELYWEKSPDHGDEKKSFAVFSEVSTIFHHLLTIIHYLFPIFPRKKSGFVNTKVDFQIEVLIF